MAYERLVRKLTHENLWIYILTLLKDGPLYGYEVRRMIEERFGFRPGQVTSYIVLYRLEKAWYIRVSRESGAPRDVIMPSPRRVPRLWTGLDYFYPRCWISLANILRP